MDFSTFDWDQLAKIRQHRWKERLNREKLLRLVAMVAKFLDENKPKTWIRTVSNFIDLILFHFICQMFAKFWGGWIRKDRI